MKQVIIALIEVLAPFIVLGLIDWWHFAGYQFKLCKFGQHHWIEGDGCYYVKCKHCGHTTWTFYP
jgi:hypothetical protein